MTVEVLKTKIFNFKIGIKKTENHFIFIFYRGCMFIWFTTSQNTEYQQSSNTITTIKRNAIY